MITPDMLSNCDDPEKLVELIDQLITQGTGHINIKAQEQSEGLTVETVKSTDCSGIKGACMQPTEDAIDSDED